MQANHHSDQDYENLKVDGNQIVPNTSKIQAEKEIIDAHIKMGKTKKKQTSNQTRRVNMPQAAIALTDEQHKMLQAIRELIARTKEEAKKETEKMIYDIENKLQARINQLESNLRSVIENPDFVITKRPDPNILKTHGSSSN